MIAFMLAAVLATATPSPTPSPSPTPPAEIGHVVATGRKADLVGKATAASEGTISQEQIATRPILRPGEVLEAIPGLVISQHSGGGKANQYYLRGFQLDHGTDLESTVNGVPVNLPTHAHGQGYSDINWLIPELVGFVEYKKGPYYADQGDFSTAGSYNLFFRNTIPNTAAVTLGGYGYGRVLLAGSPQLGAGNLLYALEYVHDNSTMEMPDNYRRYNGVLRWHRTTKADDLALTATAYSGTFASTDQIPQRLVDDGLLDRFGYVDPTDGGSTYRLALSGEWHHTDPNGTTDLTAYGFEQHLDLFSDFTYDLDDATDYYNVTANPITCNALYTTCAPGPQRAPAFTAYCPTNLTSTASATGPRTVTPAPFTFACGDQREQEDTRFVSGFTATRSIASPHAQSILGLGLRNDNISTVGLFLDHGRIRYPDGTLGDARVLERDTFAYAQSELHLGTRLRLTLGLRADAYTFDVRDVIAANSGRVSAGIVSPKFAAAYTLSPSQELYADFGDSFHSNDGRGTTVTIDPQTHLPFDATGAPVQRDSPLVRAVGEEVGYRYSNRKINTTVSLWQLNIASELTFSGDDGTIQAGRPTVRRGLELSNFFSPTDWLTIDADYATSSARFLTDPQNIGTEVPESLNAVTSLGLTVDRPTYSTSLRLRYFGPRPLIEDGSATSPASTIYNFGYTAKLKRSNRLTFDVLNLFNAQVSDITYYYASWLPHDASTPAYADNPTINPTQGGSGVNDYHFHPSEARTFRLTFVTKL